MACTAFVIHRKKLVKNPKNVAGLWRPGLRCVNQWATMFDCFPHADTRHSKWGFELLWPNLRFWLPGFCHLSRRRVLREGWFCVLSMQSSTVSLQGMTMALSPNLLIIPCSVPVRSACNSASLRCSPHPDLEPTSVQDGAQFRLCFGGAPPCDWGWYLDDRTSGCSCALWLAHCGRWVCVCVFVC